MHYTNRLRRTCGVSLTAGLMIAGLAHATTPNATEPAAQVGHLTVIGTPLQPLPADDATPVLNIDQAEIKATGLKSVGEILQRLTIAGSAPNATFNFNSTGETNVDLRNLGSQRVLVLVNGRRWVTGLDGNVDLNTIPLAMIDHIEIYKGGHAARFGSGAITGVINLVTRKNFSGAEANAYYGEYIEGSHRDGRTQSYSFTLGASTDRANVVLNASYFDREPIFGGDRAISSLPRFGTGTTRGSSTTPQGRFIIHDPNTGDRLDLTVKQGQPGTNPGDFRPFNTLTDRYNFAPVNYLLTPSERSGLYVQGLYQIAPEVVFHADAVFNRRKSEQRDGPSEIGIGANTAFPLSIAASNPYNPFGYDLTATGPSPTLLLLTRQVTETGPRFFNENVDTYQFSGGFSGTFGAAANAIGWDVSYLYNHNEMGVLAQNLLNVARIRNALGPADRCGPGSMHPDCVPLNLFGGQYHGGTITPAMLDYITYTGQRQVNSSLHDYTARVGGPIVNLPAGPLAFTVGYEHRAERGQDMPDPISAAGNSFGDFESPAAGGFDVGAEFASLSVPLLADLPGAQQLAVSLEARHARFDTFGSVDADRAGLRWRPSEDWLVRAHWSKDFRAPTIREMFGGSGIGAPMLTDPCSNYRAAGAAAAACAAAGVPSGYTQQPAQQVRTVSGANPDLNPETSTSRGIGFVFAPTWLDTLQISVDYWKIEVDDAITQLDPQQILNGCYVGGVAGYCAQIDRAASGVITSIDNRMTNAGNVLTSGFDTDVAYTFPATGWGRFGLDWRTTWLREFKETLTHYSTSGAQPIVTRRAGQEFGRIGGFPRVRSNLDLNWHLGTWSADLLVRYISDMSETCSDSFDGTPLSFTSLGLCSYPNMSDQSLSRNKLGATAYFDVRVGYDFKAIDTTLSFGIRNLFDRQPPVSMTASGSFEHTIYPVPGRFPYVSVEARF
ncbi:MAG TPA: TonB-dependent receptor [Gammaproteobacteria bacterium]|nr:TonB-dependent receptor [Gammaproteobacteria bacterium]